jgi:transposase
MRAYSLDLRQRIVDALAHGATIEQTAQRFAVGKSSVKRYKARLQETGTLAPTPWPGRTPKIKEEQQEDLRTLVASRTDWTLDALSQAWHNEFGIAPTVSVVSDTLRRFQITYIHGKKRAASPPSGMKRSAKRSGSA